MAVFSNFKCPAFGHAICINPEHVEMVIFSKRDASRPPECSVFLSSGKSYRVEGLLADVMANLESAK